MSEAPLVSIAIPAYKSTYLSRAIDSVLNQTYQNIEIIIVNDNSPQNIDALIVKYTDRRIKYFKNENNVGAKDPGLNWNICLNYAKGDFFALLCDDDTYEPTFVAEMLALVDKYPKCNVFHSDVQVITMKSQCAIHHFPIFPKWESCGEYILNRSKGLRKQTISEWMFRRAHIKRLGGYENLPLAWGADYLSVMKFSLDGGIASTQKTLVTFRRSNENITMKFDGNSELKIQAIFLYTKRLKILLEQNKELSSFCDQTCINRIKRMEDLPILIRANWKEYIHIVIKRNKYDIKTATIVHSFIKRSLNLLLCK